MSTKESKKETSKSKTKTKVDTSTYQSFAMEDTTYKTTFTKKYIDRKPYTPAKPMEIISFLPGTIGECFVKVGDSVKKGDKLLVLDAMKMNNELLAPADGTVKYLGGTTGDNVPRHFVLAEIEPIVTAPTTSSNVVK
ncbi:MAG: acetyl-CoA carboxylase biotin carboxyl carrier protein subunit [Bacteroidales bacterium]